MRQVLIPKTGPPSVLTIRERDDPLPQPGQLRIRVKASGVNFADTLARRGLYPDAPALPTVVGYEVAGVVDKVGEGVDGAEWMDRYADTVCVPVEYAFEKPKEMSFVEAAGIPVVYATAWMLIHHMGGLRQGQSILIQNAGGGVGLAAIDIAKHLGASLILGTASNRNEKHRFLLDRGLTHAIDYTCENVAQRVRELTGGRGVDLVLDPIGGSSSWRENYALLRAGGRLGMFGASSLTELSERNLVWKAVGFLQFLFSLPRWSPLALMDVNRGVFGVNLGHMWAETDRLREWMQQILQGYRDGWVRPYVSAVFPLEDAAGAHRMLEERRNVGKVILVADKEELARWKPKE